MAIISIRNITKNYANHKALDDVSIEVPAGSVFGLLGPNGAGKTSLIRIINQITGPDKGEILFDGHPLHPDHVEDIGYLPEERGLYKKMEVGEHALYLARLKGMGKREALKKLREWFIKFEMQPWWNKKVEELSKGMQQKVQFIVTVLHEPKLLILDEPFTGFDPINANLIKDELLRLRDQGCTIILSTHRMESVEELCTHIALINKSKKILEGPVRQIRHAYRSNTYKIEYSGSGIAFANSLWTGFELLENKTEGDYNSAVVKLLGENTTNNLLQVVMQQCEVHAFHELIPRMDEIFIMKVKENELSLKEVTP
ncbi:MAG: ABC transporter ATP-binding protein [Bacteroidia bacterium]